jgi:hypothetical protein
MATHLSILQERSSTKSSTSRLSDPPEAVNTDLSNAHAVFPGRTQGLPTGQRKKTLKRTNGPKNKPESVTQKRDLPLRPHSSTALSPDLDGLITCEKQERMDGEAAYL